MNDEKQPLPAAVSEYMNDRHAATPDEVMEAVGLDEHRREQVEHYCAVTWALVSSELFHSYSPIGICYPKPLDGKTNS